MTFLAAGELPIRSILTDPVVAEIDSGKYDERRQAPTISRDAFDGSNRHSLRVGTSVKFVHLGAYKVFGKSKDAEQHSSFVHIVYVLL